MILEPLILPLLIFAVTIPEQIHQTEDERNTIAVFSKAKLGVVHIKARQQESTEFGAHQHSESPCGPKAPRTGTDHDQGRNSLQH